MDKKCKSYKYPSIYKKWSEIPYPGEYKPYKGVEPKAGEWIMNYFKYRGEGIFTNVFGQITNKESTNPNDIDFVKELNIVKSTQKTLTKEQIKIAKYWASGVPIITIAPILVQLINTYKIDPPSSARMMSILSKGINDAFVICWYYKYYWNCPRPIQIDKNFNSLLSTPKFPSFPSGHSVVSSTAAEIMAYFFPMEREKLIRIAE